MHWILGDLSIDSEGVMQVLQASTAQWIARPARKATAETAESAEFLEVYGDHMLAVVLPGTAGMHESFDKGQLDAITNQIIGAAVAVHRVLGPGLLESAYEACFGYEMKKRGLVFEQQKPLPVIYDNVQIDCAYRLDFLVNAEVIVEVKSVKRITDVHVAQLLSYLRLLKKRVGLIVNFNVKWLTDQGIRRVVNGFPDA